MEVKRYGVILRRWFWLILLATGIAAGTSFFATRQMPRVYQSSTTLMVGQSLQNPNPTVELMNISQQLAQTYAQIATTDPVLQSALDDLGIQITTDRLREQVNARNIAGTSLIEIRVVDTDSVRAQAIANEMARQLIVQSPTANDQSDPQRNFVQKQVDELQRNIEEAQFKIKELQNSVKSSEGSRENEDKKQKINTLQNEINVWQQSYAGFLNYLAPRATNSVSVIDPARLPPRPIAPNVPLYVLSSAAIGMLLAVCGVFLIEYAEKRRTLTSLSRPR